MSTYIQQLYPDHLRAMNQGLEILARASYLGDSNWLLEESKVTKWSPEENKKFENALALFDKESPDRWYNVAAMIPGKTVNDVIKQYQELEEDVSDIEAGLIPVPGYTTNSFKLDWTNHHQGLHDGHKHFYVPGGKRSSSTRLLDHERKKGVPWTEEEHRQFLLGLNKYGKGDWRNISRNFVTTRAPTQVASHAQKYFIRQLSGGKDKRRSSIHDITTVNLGEGKSNSPDNNKRTSPNTRINVTQQRPQQHSNVNGDDKQLSEYDWNPPDQGSIMAFNVPSSSQLMSTIRKTSTYGPRMQHDQYPQRGIPFLMDLSLDIFN